jgi:hypothetical protein
MYSVQFECKYCTELSEPDTVCNQPRNKLCLYEREQQVFASSRHVLHRLYNKLLLTVEVRRSIDNNEMLSDTRNVIMYGESFHYI